MNNESEPLEPGYVGFSVGERGRWLGEPMTAIAGILRDAWASGPARLVLGGKGFTCYSPRPVGGSARGRIQPFGSRAPRRTLFLVTSRPAESSWRPMGVDTGLAGRAESS
jgi:hypothetical protein